MDTEVMALQSFSLLFKISFFNIQGSKYCSCIKRSNDNFQALISLFCLVYKILLELSKAYFISYLSFSSNPLDYYVLISQQTLTIYLDLPTSNVNSCWYVLRKQESLASNINTDHILQESILLFIPQYVHFYVHSFIIEF